MARQTIGFNAHKDDTDAQLPATTPLDDALNYFFQHYPPADNFKTASQYLTLDDIAEMLKGLDAGFVMPKPELHVWLKEKYRFDTIGLKTVWLIGEAQ